MKTPKTFDAGKNLPARRQTLPLARWHAYRTRCQRRLRGRQCLLFDGLFHRGR